LQYAYEAGAIGGTMPAVLNAANEIAVAAFLQEQCAFGDIPRTIRQVMATHEVKPLASLDAAIAADQWARSAASTFISELIGKQF
jgi:1-deoxy-D-xylulose-5-phosphate reductoisomerase